MGLIISNRGLQGGPMLPYPSDSQYAGNDAFIPLIFLDRNRVPVTPTSIKVEMDDLTNNVSMDNGPITLVSTGATSGNYIYPAFASGSGTPWLLQAVAALMQMTFPYQGSQIVQLKIVFTGVDSVTANTFTDVIMWIIELVSSPTVSGSL
jgi:hypothetical protein